MDHLLVPLPADDVQRIAAGELTATPAVREACTGALAAPFTISVDPHATKPDPYMDSLNPAPEDRAVAERLTLVRTFDVQGAASLAGRIAGSGNVRQPFYRSPLDAAPSLRAAVEWLRAIIPENTALIKRQTEALAGYTRLQRDVEAMRRVLGLADA